MSDNVLFYVQHLLGIGHVVRSARIARALQRAKFKVTIAYGGEPVKGIDWDEASMVQLPALSAGPDGFGTLVDETGAPVTDEFKKHRTDQLLDLFKRDREWNDGAAKTQLVTIVEALTPQDPIALNGRRKLSSMIFV